MRHVIGTIGVLAASILLVVSAAMNWRFGYSLGKTELDGLIYGSASAAADCLKALVPFFFFAAVRNKIWSQAVAAAIVGIVCAVYSLTSALGHAALNRLDSTGQRAVVAQKYLDLRSDLQRAHERLSAIPQHRPSGVVESEIKNVRNEALWSWTNRCSEVTGKTGREFCRNYNTLMGELSAAKEAELLGSKIEGLSAQLAVEQKPSAMSEADPQAAIMAQLSGLPVQTIQTALTIFIALLLEVGSCFGMFIAVSQWKLYGHDTVSPGAQLEDVSSVSDSQQMRNGRKARSQRTKHAEGSTEDKISTAIVHRLMPGMNEVVRFHNECLQIQVGATLNARDLYDFYRSWCTKKDKDPLSAVLFARQLVSLGVKKSKRSGKNIYEDIRLYPHTQVAVETNIANFPPKVA